MLVAAAVLVTGAAGLHGTGIAEALIGQIQRAICRVGGGECRAVPEPCVVASTATLDDTNIRVAILRLRSGSTLLRERRSDGSERVTLVQAGRRRRRARPGRRDRRRDVGPGRACRRHGRGPGRKRPRVDAALRARGGRAGAGDRGAAGRPRAHPAAPARAPAGAAAGRRRLRRPRPRGDDRGQPGARRPRRSMPRTSSRPRRIAVPVSARCSSAAAANCSGAWASPARSAPRPGWGATSARRWSSTRGAVRCAWR